MKVLWRFIGWATVLAVPCWAMADGYHWLLARAVEGTLALVGQRVTLDKLDVLAPNDLGFFVAMCLSTVSVPMRRRRRAVLVGLPILIVLEVVISSIAVMWALVQTVDPNSPQALGTLRDRAMATLPWVIAPAVWLAMLGATALPAEGPLGRRPEPSPEEKRPGRPDGRRASRKATSR